ncbi:MAG: alpha/beta fold hydrolase [Patescibacteria group bacterium]
MAQKDIHPHARPIALKGRGDTAFLLIHGYTGSPTDFNGLPAYLREQLDASVFVPLLPGHGTKVEDLHGLTKNDFIKTAEEALQPLLTQYKRIIVGGHSFGGQVALHLAARYPVHGVVVSATPYRPAFPLNIPGFYELWHLLTKKEFLNKRFSAEEKRARAVSDAFSYDRMAVYGLKLTLDINKDLKNLLPNVKSPLLSFFLRGDWIAHVGSAEAIEGAVASGVKKKHIIESLEHGIFFTKDAPHVYREVVEFFKI